MKNRITIEWEENCPEYAVAHFIENHLEAFYMVKFKVSVLKYVEEILFPPEYDYKLTETLPN